MIRTASALAFIVLLGLAPQAVFAADDMHPTAEAQPWAQGIGNIATVAQGVILAAPEDSACDENAEGAMRYSRKRKKLLLCDGEAWQALQAEPVTPK